VSWQCRESQQVTALVGDSEVDELLASLDYRGHVARPHSQCYAAVARAVKVASKSNLDMTSKMSWCERCLLHSLDEDDAQAAMQLAQWASLAPSAEQNSLTS
jgi:hypothetical protein